MSDIISIIVGVIIGCWIGGAFWGINKKLNFITTRVDDLLKNAGSTFCNVSERMDKMQIEIDELKKRITNDGL